MLGRGWKYSATETSPGRLRSRNILPGCPIYVLCPGASFEIKRWPEANYAELAKLIFMRTGWRGIVCGGTEDREAAASLCAAATAPLLNWAGRTSISELSAILSQARLLVANDTGAAHIAAALGTPTVCLLGGPRDAVLWLPLEMHLSGRTRRLRSVHWRDQH